jgi:hypothetical protein
MTISRAKPRPHQTDQHSRAWVLRATSAYKRNYTYS